MSPCSWYAAVAISLLSAGCAVPLREIDTSTTRTMLPWLSEHAPRSAVIERLGESWKFQDETRQILIYNMALLGGKVLTARAWDDAEAPYELVLIFDDQGHVERFRLLKVKK